jgi:hypothetical protein
VLTDARRSKGSPLSDTVDTLILELLEWMGESPRPYAEVIGRGGRRARAFPCGKRPATGDSSRVVTRRAVARSSR